MSKDRKPLGALAVVALAAILLSTMALAVDVDAARGGKGGGGNGSSATVSVAPNPVPLGTTSISISGSGYAGNQYLVINPSTIPGISVTTDATGAFSVNYTPWSGGYDQAGGYQVKVMKYKGQDLVTLATTSFTVCSTNPCQ